MIFVSPSRSPGLPYFKLTTSGIGREGPCCRCRKLSGGSLRAIAKRSRPEVAPCCAGTVQLEGRPCRVHPSGELCFPCRRVRAVSAGPRLADRGILAKLCGDGAVISQFSTSFEAGAEPRRREAKSIFNELRERYAALRGYACGKAMSYVEFSRTSSNIVRVRRCRLAVSRCRCRACDGFRSSIRSLEGPGSREKAARISGERPCRSDAWPSCAGSGELAPEVGHIKGTAGIKPPKDLFRCTRVDFRKTWHLRNKDNGANLRAG